MSEYYSDLDKCKRAGYDYADTEIKEGIHRAQDAPLSGEWADGLTGQDVLNAAGIEATFLELEDFERVDVTEQWMDGYVERWGKRDAGFARLHDHNISGIIEFPRPTQAWARQYIKDHGTWQDAPDHGGKVLLSNDVMIAVFNGYGQCEYILSVGPRGGVHIRREP